MAQAHGLPARPNLEYLRKLAKQRLAQMRAASPSAKLADAQLAVAREHGLASWRKLKAHVDQLNDGRAEAAGAELLKAVGAGDLGAVSNLLDQHPTLVNAVGPHPFWGGRPQPLHVSIEGGHQSIFELLLERGADPGGDNGAYGRWSPLMLAVHWKRDAMRDELRRRGANVGLIEALMLADDARAMDILDRDPKRATSNGWPNDGTPLHFARTPSAVRRLIELGVPVDRKDTYGQTALETITSRGAEAAPLVKILTDHGARIGARHAAALGDPEQLDRALRDDPQQLADPRVILAAVEAGHASIVARLLDGGADVNARQPDKSRATLLHVAAWAGNLEVARLLVTRGADVAALDEEHHATPAQWARTACRIVARPQCMAVAAFLDSVKPPGAAAAPKIDTPRDALLDASVPRSNEDHRGGNTDRAEALLKEHPDLPDDDIYAACVVGDAAAVEAILRRDPTLATTPGGPRDWQPLSYLCFSRFLRLRKRPVGGFVRAARLLLEHGADPNTYFLEDPAKPDSTKETALYGAAGNAHEPELTKLLLGAGADVNDLVPEGAVGSESLYHASETTDLRCLRLLLERGPRADNVSYCLARKLDFDDLEGARLYLAHGADVNFRFGFGDRNTRLHHAVIRGRSAAVIELLLNHGADVNARNAQGFTAYTLARRHGFTEVAELLLSRGAEAESDDRERFLSACAAGDGETVRRIIEENPKAVRSVTARDQRILADAAAAGHLRAVELMLSLAFDPDAPGEWGGSALHQAAWGGHADVVALLLRHGARVDTLQHFGGDVLSTAIHGAAHAGHANGAAVVKLLLPKFKGKDLAPYLKQARADGADEVARLIESTSATPKPTAATVKAGWKPLMDAALAGDADRVEKLLDAGADPNALSTAPHHYRPLHRAIEHKKTMPKHAGHERVVALLLERGADPKLRATRSQATALQLAAFGEPRFVPLLRPHFEPLDIFYAAALGEEARAAQLLKAAPSLASARDEAGWQPLHYCAASVLFRARPELTSSLARIAKLLIDAGADPMASWLYDGDWPLRPLYFACGASNNAEVARVLLEAGADPCDGESVYHASDEGHDDCLALIERHVKPKKLAKEATMCLASQLHWGRTRGMRWLLDHGADPNAVGKMFGDGALHAAARRGANEKVIATLLEHGADPRVKNREGKDAIELARAARKPRVVRQLQDALKPARRAAKSRHVASRRRARH